MSATTTSLSIGRAGSRVRTLGAICTHPLDHDAVLKRDLRWGDRVIVQTRNSVYSLRSLGGDRFLASGGWFDQQGLSPATVDVHGCTYGGTAIRTDVVAVRGLFLEIGDAVLTTRIQAVWVVTHG